MTDKLRINRADEAAAEQTGYPTLFYAIRRKFWGTHRYPVSPKTSTGTTPRGSDFLA